MTHKIRYLVLFFSGLFFLMGTGNALAIDLPIGDSNLACQCSCACKNTASATTPAPETPVTEPVPPEPTTATEVNPGDILISEFVSAPLTGEQEWVELYNATDAEVNLSGWQLADGSDRNSELSGTISAHSYLLFNKSGLNNDGDQIILKDQNGKVIDAVSYGAWDDGQILDNAPAPEQGTSLIREDLQSDYNIDFQDFIISTTVTPGLANVLTAPVDNTPEPVVPEAPFVEPTPIVTPTTIRLNEFLPNPVGTDTGSEWIEIYNYGAQTVNLKGWKLDDDEGGSTPYTISEDLMLTPGSFWVFKNDLTKLALNNDLDAARIFDPDGNLIQSVSYSGCAEGESYSYFDSSFVWNATLTPNAENEQTVQPVVLDPAMQKTLQTAAVEKLSPVKLASATKKSSTVKVATAKKTTTATPVGSLVSLDQFRSLKVGSKARVRGEVVVIPGIFDTKTMYLNGLQIYNSSGTWPTLEEGQVVEISGKVSSSQSESRLTMAKTDTVKLIEQGELSEPETIKSDDVGESFEGRLVSLTGEIARIDGQKIIIADASGEATLYLKKSVEINKKLLTEKDQVRVVGIVTQVGDEYRILPRRVSDFMNLAPVEDLTPVNEVVVMPSKSWVTPLRVSFILFFGLSSSLVYWLVRKKYLDLRQLFSSVLSLRKQRN